MTYGTITLIDMASEAPVAGTLAASSFPSASNSYEMAVNEVDGILYVSDAADGSVVFLDAATGAPFHGDLVSSTFGQGSEVETLTHDPQQGLLFVGREEGSLEFRDAVTGAPVAAVHATVQSTAARAGVGAMTVMPDR